MLKSLFDEYTLSLFIVPININLRWTSSLPELFKMKVLTSQSQWFSKFRVQSLQESLDSQPADCISV